jgi:hypothetical protein
VSFRQINNVNGRYSIRGQSDTFKDLLGQKQATDLVKDDGLHFLSRGHLAANADFMFNSQQGELDQSSVI